VSDSQQNHSPARQTTGIDGLDEVLNGGLPARRLFVVEGDPGSGKTTLALQFLREGVRLGQRVLYITLSETHEELISVAESHNWSLDGIDILELHTLAGEDSEDNIYTVYHPSDVELAGTTKRIRAEVERLNPERVALDSVSELKILSQTGVRYRREVLGLKQFFAGRNCTVMVLDDLTSRDGEQQLQSMAHGVIRIEREGREYGTTRRQLHVVKMRGVRFQDGRHDFIIQTGGLELYPRLSSRDTKLVRHDGTAASGSRELDSLLGGGLDRGASTLLIGPAGSGKTTLSAHYLLAALQRGEKAVCFQFEESRDTFLDRSAGMGMQFSPFVEDGSFRLVRVTIADLSPGEFASQVQRAVEREKVSFVVIDSLNGYLNGMPSERYLLIHMHELLAYLGQKGVVTIMTVAQHGMTGVATTSPIDVSFLADSVILLRFFEAAGAVRQAISVVKRRHGAHERTLREMKLSSEGIHVGDILEEFQGVLTGVPRFHGKDGKLMPEQTRA